MANITLAIPDEIHKKMKKYKEIRWSEVVRRAIVEHIKKIEEGGFELTTKQLLKELGEDFRKSLDELSLEKAVEGYEKMRDAEWKRPSTTQQTDRSIQQRRDSTRLHNHTEPNRVSKGNRFQSQSLIPI